MAEHKRQDVQGAMFGSTHMATVEIMMPSKSASGDAGTFGKDSRIRRPCQLGQNNGDCGRDELLGASWDGARRVARSFLHTASAPKKLLFCVIWWR
jgi:hypothetical protein